MIHSVKNEKRIWAGTLLIALVSLILIFLPTVSVFSQTAHIPSDDSSSYNIKRRQYIDLLGSVFDYVHRNYVDEVDPEILYQGAMKGLMDSLEDPYTTYMDLSMTRDISDTTAGNFGGVGLQITKAVESTPEKPAYVEVSHPMEGTPGYLAGIQPQDKIISIDGTDTSTITMDEVLNILRGEIGTTVDLIIRRGESMEFPSKDERTTGIRFQKRPAGDNRPSPGWFPCRDYPKLINIVKKTINRYKPDADIIFWSYNWGWAPKEDRLSLIENLPKDISLLVTFDMWQYFVGENGERYRIHDYSISF